jgi:hypothetical protein
MTPDQGLQQFTEHIDQREENKPLGRPNVGGRIMPNWVLKKEWYRIN